MPYSTETMNLCSSLQLQNIVSVRGLPCALLLAALAAFGVRQPFGQSVPALINYQGRLTDAEGAALPNGSYRVAFKLWNQPLVGAPGDRLIWGREYGVTLLDGQFHVILGDGGTTVSDAAVNDLGFAFSEAARFLGLTVLDTPSGRPASPQEIVPRQQILSAPFAVRAQSARAADGVLPGVVDAAALATNAVQTAHLAPGAVTIEKLGGINVRTNAGVGELAGGPTLPGEFRVTSGDFVDVTGLAVTLQTTGRRPVEVFLGNGIHTEYSSVTATYSGSCCSYSFVRLLRNGQVVATLPLGHPGSIPLDYPPGSIRIMDFPGAGRQSYQIQASVARGGGNTGNTLTFDRVRLFAREW